MEQILSFQSLEKTPFQKGDKVILTELQPL